MDSPPPPPPLQDEDFYLYYVNCSEFQKRVLHLLTEIRNTLQQVGKKYEPVDSEFQIEQIRDIGQLGEVEDSLTTEESRKLMVSNF